ncbi:hypothetical protein RJ640_001411 [Escallonia rubra]|uniref:Uncharacterized protein n=1 Tax=Escallonia rubra TaxID=112253 RepID=A0AA88QVR8_9ASTE|nr:hypothetical protein RJ640_001411 [Escallonia rubra]
MSGGGSVEDLGAPPDSWEVADLDATMSRLLLSSNKNSSSSNLPSTSSSPPELVDVLAPSTTTSLACGPEDFVNSVDQFLREALQNPRERLSEVGKEVQHQYKDLDVEELCFMK